MLGLMKCYTLISIDATIFTNESYRMSKHQKRIHRARNNPKNVSYTDFISILDKEGYTIRDAKGSHQVAYKKLDTKNFKLVFARPHGNKTTVDIKAVKDLLQQLDEINEVDDE